MQFVPSSFLAFAAIAVLIVQGPRRGVWAFFALAPFGAAAAFNLPAVGGATIGPLDLAAVVVFVIAWFRPQGANAVLGCVRPGLPGFWLVCFLIYCMFSAMFAPRLFEGATDIFSLSRSANQDGIVSIPLRPTNGNITQAFRMMLGVLAFLGFATVFRLRPQSRPVVIAMITATVLHVVLGGLDLITFSTGATALMEPIRTANYAILEDHYMMGFKRMIGGFPEASAYGAFSLALFAFWLQFWLSGIRSRWASVMLVASFLVLVRSTSSGAYVALVVFVLAYGGYLGITRFRSRLSRRAIGVSLFFTLFFFLSALGLFMAYQLVAPVTAYLDSAVFDKLATQSGLERMSWNAQAFQNFRDTWMVGAGLGSVRASNWLVASLGSIGVIGTLLYLAFLVSLLTMPRARDDGRLDATVMALKSACVATFINEMLIASTPNPGLFFFALAGLAAGLSRGSVVQQDGRRPGLRRWPDAVRSPIIEPIRP